jgi:type IV secretory pathway VirB2 component (pilin)
MIALYRSIPLRSFASWRWLRQIRQSFTLFFLLALFPVLAQAQIGGWPFDTGFTALQNLFTGTIAKVASLIAIVIGGYEFAHGEPGAKNSETAGKHISEVQYAVV